MSIGMEGQRKAVALLDELIKSHDERLSTESGRIYDPSLFGTCDAVTLLDTLIYEMETSLSCSNASELLASIASSEGTKSKKEGKSSKSKKAVAPPPVTTEEITINSLDLRVGEIVHVEVHPNADKLYCEDIAIGEESPRKIASGLVPYYTLEQMQGRRLIVVANLKPRNLVGFKSNGMVLCASSEDADGNRRVEFVDPPSDAPIGARVYAPDLGHGDPLGVNQCDKKKAFALIAPDLSINEDGHMVWKGHRVVCGDNQGPCVAPSLRNCPVG